VTDTREVDDIPANHFWYVVGQASAFTGPGGASISADHFGWTPRLVDGGDTGLVSEGEQVKTSEDTGDDAVGLIDQELLYTALDSAAVKEGGESSWTADAALVLKTDTTVTPRCVLLEADAVTVRGRVHAYPAVSSAHRPRAEP
jgi:hypothetical protein